MTLQIRAEVSAVDHIGATWNGPPLSMPGTVGDYFGNYPNWRKYFDHDNDPTTPPRDFGPHGGIDLANRDALNPILCADRGVVWYIGLNHEVRGNYVIVTHRTDEPAGQPFPATYYLHLNEVLVQPGQTVEAGQPVGIEGWTGAVTGRHVHFGVRLGDAFVNPMNYLVDPTTPVPAPAFDPMPSGRFTLSEYESGTVAELGIALAAAGAEVAYFAEGGGWLIYHVGAPDFVNEAVFDEFPNGVPSGTVLMIGDLK